MSANHFSLGDQGKLLWGGDYNIHAFYFLCFLMVWHLGTLQILERLPLLVWTNSWRQQILLIYRPTNPESISSSFPFIRLLRSRTLSLCPKAPKTKWFLTGPFFMWKWQQRFGPILSLTPLRYDWPWCFPCVPCLLFLRTYEYKNPLLSWQLFPCLCVLPFLILRNVL